MFEFLKSKDTQKKETEIHKVGEELFRQISRARNILDEDNFNRRINSMFSAGYIAGFIAPKLSYLFEDNKTKRKYLEQVLSSIFPSSGIKFFDSKLNAYNLGKSLLENENSNLNPEDLYKVMEEIKEYELGVATGNDEISAWEADNNYAPFLLLDYLKSADN
ncbi:MAG: hypothetical protein RDU01_07530 [Thermodesulfovibrionales bacterium]|nr:hypothetical protein [Thermodesulfovibrionales bacterium]